ncbi:MAG: GspE/PulE family protein [Candidatus Omnitrophota bacterium]
MALRLGEILVEKGIITAEQLDSAVKEQAKTKEVLGQILVNMGLVSERQLLEVLSQQQGIPFVDLREAKIDPNAIKNVPAKLARHYKVMPLELSSNVLTVAISDPFDMWPLDDLETNLGYRVEKVLATSADISAAIREHYGVGADTIEKILGEDKGIKAEAQPKEKVEDLEKMAGDASVVNLVNQILQQGIDDRATDIHFERFRDELILRYRVDGILYDTQVSDNIKYLYSAIISRIKIMSGLDIIERRLPQDGRAKVRITGKEYDLRISVLPTLYGENVVIRILPTTMLFDGRDLGMSAKDDKALQKLIAKPYGIIFVTGPTGSGKSTTLYSCLSRLNTRERKIVTIEDPVEYELRGISQIQVNPKINLTFARTLRSILRHDPDVIMVGEVRDTETAQITIQTALTGHLVFSTLHTNDSSGGISRLVDMGIDPFLITSSVEAFIAQRLVRVICDKCGEKIIDDSFAGGYYKGKGCKACNNSGYSGRTGIYEILVVSEAIRKMVLQKRSADEIKKKAIEEGMNTLSDDGWEKVRSGVTTPDEVRRVTQIDNA